MTTGRERVLPLRRPLQLGPTLAPLRRGRADPTTRVIGGMWWLGLATPEGAAAVAVQVRAGEAVATAWGEGASRALDGIPDLLGEGDDDEGFQPLDDLVRHGRRLLPGWRITRSRLVIGALVPAILEQKVTGKEAFGAQARLVRRFGRPAPGPGADLGLWVPPTARDWAAIPSWEWLRAGVDGSRSATVQRAVAYAGRLEQCAALPLVQAHARLRAIPGVGEWTAAEVAQRALGDPDSPSFGDYHFAKNLTWAYTGTPAGDDEARELLAPYAGHRYRAAVLALAAAGSRPRRGARMTLPTHLPR